jgi:hypothetical protein
MDKQHRQFLANVNKESGVRVETQTSDCWIWEGCKCNLGYGQFQTDWAKELGTIKAHRIAYHLFKDSFLPTSRDKVIMHLCDNRICVNPEHLQLATQLENNKDRDAKGRQVSKKGVENTSAIFDTEDLETIRMLRMQGMEINDIAKHYECTRHTIGHILNGKTYDRFNTEQFITIRANMLVELTNCWIKKLHEQGLSYSKIKEIVNRSPAYICKVLKK